MMTRGVSSLEKELYTFEMLTTLVTVDTVVFHYATDGPGNISLWRINFRLLPCMEQAE